MTTLNDLNGYLDDEAYTVRVGELRALLSASIADTAPRAHAIDCEYIQDDNPWARCTCGVGGPNDGRKSIADTAGAKPQTDAEALYGAWQSTIAYMYEQHATPPAPSVADARRDAIYRKALAMGDAPDVTGPDSHEHNFEVEPSSGIELCTYCGMSRVAAKKAPSVADAAGVIPFDPNCPKCWGTGEDFDQSKCDCAAPTVPELNSERVRTLQQVVNALHYKTDLDQAQRAVREMLIDAKAATPASSGETTGAKPVARVSYRVEADGDTYSFFEWLGDVPPQGTLLYTANVSPLDDAQLQRIWALANTKRVPEFIESTRALLAAIPTSSVVGAAGMKLVPIEPTWEMIGKGSLLALGKNMNEATVRQVWEGMLSVAPCQDDLNQWAVGEWRHTPEAAPSVTDAAGADEPFGWVQPKGGNYFTRSETTAKRIGGFVPVYLGAKEPGND